MLLREFDDAVSIHHVEDDTEAQHWAGGFVDAYRDVFRGPPYFEDISQAQAKRVYEGLRGYEDSITLIATEGERVVAFGIAVPLRFMYRVAAALTGLVPTKHTYYLAELGVRPEYRGRGLGQALIYERLKLMDTDLYSHVVLRVSESRNTSKEMYESMGFEDMGVTMQVTARRTDGEQRPDSRLFLSRVLSQVDVE